MRLEFEPTATAGYEAVTDPDLLDKIDAILDELEKDPGQARLRQHRWSEPPLWGVTARDRVRDILILWAPEPPGRQPETEEPETGGPEAQETVIVVHYIGPDT
ncbi:MAG: hypothetical protein J2P25_05475 [Nocardiopsaceae bacterium]|nr:hypothetical protein [Nocardiopsaceae bacterium]